MDLLPARLLQRGELPGGAHENGVQHRVAEGGAVDLGDIGHAPGPLPVGQGADVPAIHTDAAAAALQRA